MSLLYRANRKATDDEIIKLNSLGYSLATIAARLDCNPSTITIRLKTLNIPPADTRRAFMEDIVSKMPQDQQNWLADQLGPHLNIKQYVKNLIVSEFIKQEKS